jgi:hypothetical protein
MTTLKIMKVGKKKYYKDPLKGAYRNIENPQDVRVPNSQESISRMLEKVRYTEDW